MPLSVIIPYQMLEDTSNLRNCLRTLSKQTVKPHQVIVADDSDERREPFGSSNADRVAAHLRERCSHTLLHIPNSPLPQWSKKFNAAFQGVSGDKILLCCANWLLAPHALEAMERALDLVGPGCIVASDSQRQQMQDANGASIDWYGYIPAIYGGIRRGLPVLDQPLSIFESQNYNEIDVGYLQALHKGDWLPWDEDFDAVGGWHAVIEWGYRQMQVHQKKLYILRGLLAWHQPTGFTFNPGDWLEQTKTSQRLLATKIPGFPSE